MRMNVKAMNVEDNFKCNLQTTSKHGEAATFSEAPFTV